LAAVATVEVVPADPALETFPVVAIDARVVTRSFACSGLIADIAVNPCVLVCYIRHDAFRDTFPD